MTRDQWRRIGIGVGVALAVGALLYFGGRWQERGSGASERAARTAEVESVRADLARTQAELTAAEDRIRLLRARSLLFESAVELDRRNFGTANQHLHAAAAELEDVREGGPGMDLPGLQALQRNIAAANFNVATDLEAQRALIMEFVTRLDALMPRE